MIAACTSRRTPTTVRAAGDLAPWSTRDAPAVPGTVAEVVNDPYAGIPAPLVWLDLYLPIVAAGAAGAALASFFCVVAERGWSGAAKGRSRCVCGRQLGPADLVPVLSWLALRGRASCCGAVIPWRYVAAEASAGFSVGAAMAVGALPGAFAALTFVAAVILTTCRGVDG